MRLLKVIVTVMAVVLGQGEAPARKKAPPPSRQDLRASLQRLLLDLAAMQRANVSNPDARSREKVAASIERAMIRVRAALEGKAQLAMTAQDHGKLLKQLSREKRPQSRIERLRQGTRMQLVSCEQAVALLQTFGSRSQRIAAAAYLWPRLADRRQLGLVLQAVGDKQARSELMRRVKFR